MSSEQMSSSSTDSLPDVDLSDTNIVTRYKMAGDIANKALEFAIARCVAGAAVSEICASTDNYIREQCATVFTKNKTMQKGISFPTCVSVNSCLGHFAAVEPVRFTLAEGQMAKIDLGVHIDGYAAVAAHTVVIGREPTEREADVMSACATAVELAKRLIRPGKSNAEVTAIFEKTAKQFACEPMAGVLSHEMTRFVLDGEKCILSRQDPHEHIKDATFTPGTVWAVDMVMSSSSGRAKQLTQFVSVFKRTDRDANLKIKASRSILAEIDRRFPHFPFCVRDLPRDAHAQMGLSHCVRAGLVEKFPILHEMDDSAKVAHFKCTVLVTENGTVPISGLPVDLAGLQEKAQHKLEDEELQQLLAMSVGKKKKKRRAKKKAAAAKN
ncbi:MAG: hypothetical protein MHM6MM_003486 [Cercozoa sp. M6MM]